MLLIATTFMLRLRRNSLARCFDGQFEIPPERSENSGSSSVSTSEQCICSIAFASFLSKNRMNEFFFSLLPPCYFLPSPLWWADDRPMQTRSYFRTVLRSVNFLFPALDILFSPWILSLFPGFNEPFQSESIILKLNEERKASVRLSTSSCLVPNVVHYIYPLMEEIWFTFSFFSLDFFSLSGHS